MRNLILSIFLLAALVISPTTSLRADIVGFRQVESFADIDGILMQSQVWDIAMRESGDYELYLASNDGLFLFNGIYMERIEDGSGSIVRALKFDADNGRLYSGGVNNFGWWEKDGYGSMKYHSIYTNEEFRRQSYDFWRIGIFGDDESRRILFQSRERIYVYDPKNESLTFISPDSQFNFLYNIGHDIYVQDGSELQNYNGEGFNSIASVSGRIVNLISSDNTLVAAVENSGLIRIAPGGQLQPLDNNANTILKNSRITCFRKYNDDFFMVGTSRKGLYITDKNGHIQDYFRIGHALDYATILCSATDMSGNIWIGMDSGAAMVDNSSGDYYFWDDRLGQIHKILGKDDSTVLIGSNKGLFILKSDNSITPIEGTAGPVWDICTFNGITFIAHDKGLFRLTDNLSVTPVYTASGVFNMHCFNDGNSFVLGTYSGLTRISFASKTLSTIISSNRINYNGFTRNIAVDSFDRIWVTVAKTGFVRLTLDAAKRMVIDEHSFDIAAKEPYKDVFSTLIDDKLFLCSSDKAYSVDNEAGLPEESDGVEKIILKAGKGLLNMIQSGNRFWFLDQNGLGYLERSGADLLRYHAVLEHVNLRRATHLSPVGDGCAVGVKNGFGLTYGQPDRKPSLKISKVIARGSKKDIPYVLQKKEIIIPPENNTICIYLSGNTPGEKEFQYRVSPSTEWKKIVIDEFLQIPSLPSGTHLIEIRSSSDYQAMCSLSVKVKVPWYLSWPMCLFFVLVIITFVYSIKEYYKRKNRKLKEEEVKRLEYQNLLQEKKISEIEREQLRSELKYKGQELANITINTSRRNSLINGLISKLQTLNSFDDTEDIKNSASELIRELEVQLKDESDWQKSEGYFNTIYDGLLDRLKSTYPSLSKTDMKLCVYIKLNMTTKEMANLMNISPRSVEMARYRLRKKLGLHSDDDIRSVLR